MFAEHMKREATEELRRRNLAIIAGSWANTNLDMEENDRQGMLKSIDESTEAAIDTLYSGKVPGADDEVPWEDPLFGPLKETVYSPEFDELVETVAPTNIRKFEARLIEDES